MIGDISVLGSLYNKRQRYIEIKIKVGLQPVEDAKMVQP